METTVIDRILPQIREEDPRSVWEYGEWPEIRGLYDEMWSWYKGREWEDRVQQKRDPTTGEQIKVFPLQLNPIAKVCRIHRAVLLGMSPTLDNRPPITTQVNRIDLDSDSARKAADQLERYIARTWYNSHGGSQQHQMGLLMQVYGGYVYRVFWQPYDLERYPTAIGITGMAKTGFFFPVSYDPNDPWNLLECYLGYPINPDTCRLKFGIEPENELGDVLYLEHWTKNEYRITVDGKVPMVQVKGNGATSTSRMEGPNVWGRIPIVYIPHERDGEYYGRSLVLGDSTLVGLSRELNARMADKGIAAQQSMPVHWMKNVKGTPSVREVLVNGVPMMVYDLGVKSAMPNSGDPEMGVAQSPGVPKGLSEYQNDIWNELRHQADIAAVALGDDDVSGGRITGPVTAYRMWPTLQHTMTERAFVSAGMHEIAKLIRLIAYKMQGRAHKVPVQITDEMMSMEFSISWQPMIPLEQDKIHTQLLEQYKAGAISLVSLLRELGTSDPEAEAEAILQEQQVKMQQQQQMAMDMMKAKAQSEPSPTGTAKSGGDQ